jgi:hypothetical protein
MADDATINKIRRNCVLCTKYGNYRLVLRLCNHCICVSCAIPYLSEWIQNKQKSTFIDCPKQTCQHIIHENDIAALLDISMSDADTIMSDCNRGWLQRHHNRRGILAAFDGKLRSCPNCQVLLLFDLIWSNVLFSRMYLWVELDAILCNASNVAKSFVLNVANKQIRGNILCHRRANSVGTISGEFLTCYDSSYWLMHAFCCVLHHYS